MAKALYTALTLASKSPYNEPLNNATIPHMLVHKCTSSHNNAIDTSERF
jgi:hypothetical protein